MSFCHHLFQFIYLLLLLLLLQLLKFIMEGTLILTFLDVLFIEQFFSRMWLQPLLFCHLRSKMLKNV